VTIYQDYFESDKVKIYSRLTDFLLLLVVLFILPIILI